MIVDAVKVRDEGFFCKLCGPFSKARGKQSNAISPRWFELDLSDMKDVVKNRHYKPCKESL